MATPTNSEQLVLVQHLPALRGFVVSLVSDYSLVLVDDVVKKTILEIYDARVEAMQSGKPYQTHLASPPLLPSSETDGSRMSREHLKD